MPAELWENAGYIADLNGTNRGAIVKDLLRWYTGEPGARLPRRATPSEIPKAEPEPTPPTLKGIAARLDRLTEKIDQLPHRLRETALEDPT